MWKYISKTAYNGEDAYLGESHCWGNGNKIETSIGYLFISRHIADVMTIYN